VSSDTLSDVLRAVRLTGAVFFDVDARAPWVAEAPAARDVAEHILPGSEHVIEYHLLTSGRCHASVVGGASVELNAGDLVIFPQGDAHVMSSAPGMRGVLELSVYRRPIGGALPIRFHEGGSGEASTLICGFLGYDARPFNPLLSTLPRTLVMRHEQLSSRPSSALASVAKLTELAVVESRARRAGSECMLSRLSELLFVEAIRAHVEMLNPEASGWLAGLRDPHAGKALALLHGRPAHAWSIEELSNEVGLSKSLLIERFVHFTGMPPMQYLAKWRMQLAAERLRATNESLAEIAEHVGYGSESAFSRAFKRMVGVAPANFRKSATLTNGTRAQSAPAIE
jgi:AraC-like DNA-binding protein